MRIVHVHLLSIVMVWYLLLFPGGWLKDLERLMLAGSKPCACEVEARPSRSLVVKTPEVRGLGA